MSKITKLLFIFSLLFSFMFLLACNKTEDKKDPDEGKTVDPEPEPDPEPEEKEYTIHFTPDNGKSIPDVKFKENEFPTLPTPEKNHYIFDGWFEDETLVSSITENKDYNIKAHWSKEKYTINFYVNDELISSKEYEYTEKIEIPTVEDFSDDEYYYEFMSWDASVTMAVSDLDVHAVFEKTKLYNVTIKYNGNDIYNEKVKEYSKLKDIDFSIYNDYNYKYELDSLYLNEELTSRYTDHTVKSDLVLYAKLLIKPNRSTYEGMTISILGDSISTFYKEGSPMNSYYNEKDTFYYPIYSATVKTVDLTWWYLAIQKLNCTLGINNSWSGSSCYNNGNSSNSGAMNFNRINTLGENGTPDIIICFIGTNDLVNGYDDSALRSSYQTMLKRIHEKYPSAYIFCINLAYTGNSLYNYNEEGRVKYNAIIAAACKKYNAFLIDWSGSMDNDTARSCLGDSLHYNKDGMEKLSQVVSNHIKEFFNNGIAR